MTWTNTYPADFYERYAKRYQEREPRTLRQETLLAYT